MYIVCCEPEAKAVLGDVKGLDVRDLNAKNLPPAKAGDVQIVVTPVGFLKITLGMMGDHAFRPKCLRLTRLLN